MATNVPVTLDTPIIIKVLYQGHNRKFKVPLRDLGPQVLPDKLRSLLQVHPDDEVVFERYSDSAASYVTLEADKPQVYKTLFRAAKAKFKLRLRATLLNDQSSPSAQPAQETIVQPIQSPQGSSLHRLSADTLTSQAPEQVVPVIAQSPNPPSPPMLYQKPSVETVQESPVSPLLTNKLDEGEAPVPRSFPAQGIALSQDRFFRNLRCATTTQLPDLTIRPKEEVRQPVVNSWVVFCNNCNLAMEKDHFHCSICDNGDYDLCQSCVDAGIHCPGVGHWMVKRFVKNGNVINSVSEKVAPKIKDQEMPGAFTDEKQSVEPEEPTRTCNSCVHVLPEKEFVTCEACEDYDLCIECHVANKHGHHPGHSFKAATAETVLPVLADFLCNAGRNVRHSAVCDGCEKFIYGVRHKCLNCPDWDFCSTCIKSAKFIHPRHRFVPIYEPLSEPVTAAVRHHGIYCDGPLCKDKENSSYIEGIRYKCAVCHDTDFCANCEAIPSNRHNRTHPLIQFKTPVRSVSVTTMGEDKNGLPMARLGDQPSRRSTATETSPITVPTNAATQVQTIVDMKPTEAAQPKPKEKIEIQDLLTEPVPPKNLSVPTPAAEQAVTVKKESLQESLDAHFVRDTIPDGSKIGAGLNFVQVWTLRNPGPKAWPAGCSVRHVGGDNMLNLDNTRPLSQSELAEASESNVMGRPVEPGEEISFRIMMKAPNREGTAISYWRLKTAQGTPFGHRLWCDIQVVGPTTPITIPTAQSPSQASTKSTGSSVEHNKTSMDNKERLYRLHMVRKAALEHLINNRKAMELDIQAARRNKFVAEPLVKMTNVEVDAAPAPLKQETAELPVSEKSSDLTGARSVEAKGESSGMIFPQLEKESPSSSTHEATTMQSAPTETSSESATVSAPATQSDEEFFEDAESVEIRSMSSDDEGFMTDEEYDILDASDEELA